MRRPGAYPIAGAISAADLAGAAEGVLSLVEQMTLDISRAVWRHGHPGTHRKPMAIRQALATTSVRSGDECASTPHSRSSKPAACCCQANSTGPGLYSIRKGETLSQLIARAGGLSPLAYPYGAIFTRRSVKELQQEGLRRTSRELTNSLLAVSARKETSGEALLAGQSLITQLATVEAPGRVVVEADPRVLAMRRDLDTVLESGDAMVMPKRPNFVLALGDVSNPGALQFVAGKSVGEYVQRDRRHAVDGRQGADFCRAAQWHVAAGGQAWLGIVAAISSCRRGRRSSCRRTSIRCCNLDLARDIDDVSSASLLTSVATIAILANK